MEGVEVKTNTLNQRTPLVGGNIEVKDAEVGPMAWARVEMIAGGPRGSGR